MIVIFFDILSLRKFAFLKKRNVVKESIWGERKTLWTIVSQRFRFYNDKDSIIFAVCLCA